MGLACLPITPEQNFRNHQNSSRVIYGETYQDLITQLDDGEVLVFAAQYRAEISIDPLLPTTEPVAFEISGEDHYQSVMEKNDGVFYNHLYWWAYKNSSK